jgi:ribosomal protein L10
VQNVSENLEKYDFVYVFGYDNLRAKVLKDLRASMKDDRQEAVIS